MTVVHSTSYCIVVVIKKESSVLSFAYPGKKVVVVGGFVVGGFVGGFV